MKKQKAGYIVISLVLALSLVMPAQVANAAQQTITVPTEAASDDPHVNSDSGSPIVSSLGVSIQSPLNDNTTQIDDASVMTGSPNAYTWRLNLSQICSGAELLSLRIITQTVAEDEEPTTGVFLNPYRLSDLTMFDEYTVNGGSGEDSNTWVPAMFGFDAPAIDRGTIGTQGPFTTFPADSGMSGTLDGTWDVSGYDSDQGLGIYVQHWMAGDTAIAQTYIESVQLTYDDAGCASSVSGESGSSDDVQTELAATGDNTSVVILVSMALLISSFALVARNRRKLLS